MSFYFPNIDPVYVYKRKGDETEPFLFLRQTSKIVNGKVILKEVPDFQSDVIVKNSYEAILTETTSDTLLADQFRVDYSVGIVFFHSSLEGQNITIEYHGTGYVSFPAERIWIETTSDTIETTVQDIIDDAAVVIDDATTQATYAKNQGDYAKSKADNITHKGEYSPIVSYKSGNVVQYGGSHFMCEVDATAGIDPLNGTYWSLVSPQSTINDESWTATEGQTVFTLTNGTYAVGQGYLEVWVGGVPQIIDEGFSETNDTSFTISESVPVGTKVYAKWFEGAISIAKTHVITHELGGTDELDITKLKNYQEQVVTPLAEKETDLKQRAINVRTPPYNAKGDGTTNDTVIIKQALLDGAGGTVFFPKGRYLISETLIIPSGTFIVGDNTYDTWGNESQGTVIVTTGAGNPAIWTDIDGADLSIAPALVLGGNEIKIENLTVECGSTRWDVGIFAPCVKRTSLYNVDTKGQWKKAGLYLDATWSNLNTTLTTLHPEINTSTGMNEFHAEDCYFQGGLWGVLVQGTTREFTGQEWVWGWGGTSDLSFVSCRFGSDAPTIEKQLGGGGFKHDVQLGGISAVGQGHNFINCSFRVGSKYMVRLDRSNRDTFVNCYGETLSSWISAGNPAATFSITDKTGEVSRINDRINADIDNNGTTVAYSSATYADAKVSFIRTDGRIVLPNFNGLGTTDNAPEIISYQTDGQTNFYSHNGTTKSLMAFINKNILHLKNIPEIESDVDFSIDSDVSVRLKVGNATQFRSDGIDNITYKNLVPNTDNNINLGSASRRYGTIYAGTGAINTSDRNAKQQISTIDDAVLDAWADVNYSKFKFNDAVALKGEQARWHIGVVAQEIEETFILHGLNAFDYGLLCYDVWEDQYDEGILVIPAGNLYSVRHNECIMLESALMRRTNERLEARLAALENM